MLDCSFYCTCICYHLSQEHIWNVIHSVLKSCMIASTWMPNVVCTLLQPAVFLFICTFLFALDFNNWKINKLFTSTLPWPYSTACCVYETMVRQWKRWENRFTINSVHLSFFGTMLQCVTDFKTSRTYTSV